MISRKNIPKGTLGDYCELLASAAFLASGSEVAFPYGNQYGWDMLVRESKEVGWMRVQVKTSKDLKNGDNPAVHIYRGDKNRTSYTESDLDLLVVVHPETGTMWRVPIYEFSGARRVVLQDRHVWQGNVVRQTTPLAERKTDLVIKRLERRLEVTHERQAVERAAVRASLPVTQPAHISKETWDMVTRWSLGEGYKRISKDYETSQASIRQRIIRGLKRLGASSLPESFKKTLDPLYRKKADQTKRAPRHEPPDPAQGTLLS